MPTTILIIHGWNDSSNSFENLRNQLRIDYPQNVIEEILFVEYSSKEDSLTFPIIAEGLNERMKAHGLIDENGKGIKDLYIIVHSTGALVIRHWLATYYIDKFGNCPVKKLIMLAPANFGSPWAHKGQSLLGHIFKGQKNIKDLGEVGKQILNGLELASPYQWQLSHRDLLPTNTYFTPDKIQTTVLVGLEDSIDGFFYKLISKFTLNPGTDNTVVIAGTSINTIKFTLDYSNQHQKVIHIQDAGVIFAFGLLPNVNHLNIRDKVANTEEQAYEYLNQALKIGDTEEFNTYSQKLGENNETYYHFAQKYKPYQLFVVHTTYQDGESVEDFIIEFSIYEKKSNDSTKELISDDLMELDKYSKQIHDELTRDFHKNQSDGSYRSFLVDVRKVDSIITQAVHKYPNGIILAMKVLILSDVSSEKYIVLFDSSLKDKQLLGKDFLYPNTTTLMEIKVDRKVSEEYVRMVK